MNKSPNLSAEAKEERKALSVVRSSGEATRRRQRRGRTLSSAGACNAIMSRGRSWEVQGGGAGSGSQRFLAGARTDRGAEALDDRRSQQLGAVARVTRERERAGGKRVYVTLVPVATMCSSSLLSIVLGRFLAVLGLACTKFREYFLYFLSKI